MTSDCQVEEKYENSFAAKISQAMDDNNLHGLGDFESNAIVGIGFNQYPIGGLRLSWKPRFSGRSPSLFQITHAYSFQNSD